MSKAKMNRDAAASIGINLLLWILLEGPIESSPEEGPSEHPKDEDCHGLCGNWDCMQKALKCKK